MDIKTMTKKQRNNAYELLEIISLSSLISGPTMEKILDPCHLLPNDILDDYSLKLINIIKTSKTEQEILNRAQEALRILI